jgi:propanediol dehydratase medium subunit
VNDANDYSGPGTGYHLSDARYGEICAIPQALDPLMVGASTAGACNLCDSGPAEASSDTADLVIALGPAFGSVLQETLLGIAHEEILEALIAGIAEEGLRARIVKIYASSDLGFIGHAGSQLSGSGISIGIQSKGTTVIHKRGLEPLNNLELFPQAPNLTLDSYRTIGRNAAKYAKGERVLPVPIQVDNMARLKYIVKTTILHRRETEQVDPTRRPAQLLFQPSMVASNA